MKTLMFVILSLFTQISFADNLRLIESRSNSFSIYRSGEPSADDIREYCRLGIQEIMVMSGDAKDFEIKYQNLCPSLKVIYNEEQDDKFPLSSDFLSYFDSWVQEAQMLGKKIAFRCSCGCHRTGRLAAYYQMKYQNLTSVDAIAIMNKHGKYMSFHKHLEPQVIALEDYLKRRPCTVNTKYCVQ